MVEKAGSIIMGASLALRLFKNARVVVAIEDNKPAAIEAFEAQCKNLEKISVMPLKTKYPQGGERRLIASVTGRKINSHMLPADAGVVVLNVATAFAIYEALCESKPLIHRIVTLTGDGMNSPCNADVLLGTPVSFVVEKCGGLKENTKKIISGGPMMGMALQGLDYPVTKTFSSVLALTEDDVEAMKTTACIRCGRCVGVCPENLVPQLMAHAVKALDFERFEAIGGLECIECGCCTYVCPAKRPLTQSFKLAKAEIRAAKAKAQGGKNNMYNVSVSPHIRDKSSTRKIMIDVCIALVPTLAFGVWHFGINALFVIISSVLSCVVSEAVFELIVKKPITVFDFSAVVTGLILALNMPPNIAWWVPAIGGVFAIVIVKMLFGGIGQNIMNPALAARCFLLISFASRMTDFQWTAYHPLPRLQCLNQAEALTCLMLSSASKRDVSVRYQWLQFLSARRICSSEK